LNIFAATMSLSDKPSGDGLGAFSQKASSSAQMDDEQFRQMVEGVASVNGTATLVSKANFTSVMTRVYALFGATSKEEKSGVDVALTYFFAVHGTSPETAWATYEQPIVGNGRTVRPLDVINIMGLHRLKKTMGHFSNLAVRMVAASAAMRAALSERAARANLAAGQEHMAIDFVGKDGSLSHSEATARVAVRDRLLSHRARNMNNLSEQHGADRLAASATVDSRSAGAGQSLLRFDS